MATHMMHENSFVDELVRFVQPNPGSIGFAIIIRLEDGNFLHSPIELPDRMFLGDQGTFDGIVHETVSKLLAIARKGPGSLIVPEVSQ